MAKISQQFSTATKQSGYYGNLVVVKNRPNRNTLFLRISLNSILTMLLILPFYGNALDIVTVNVGESKNDKRILFKNELVKRALEITKEDFGPYKIVENPLRMNISRAFRELEKGENLTLTFAHTRAEFEQRAWPIRVPLRRGIGSYRLLMIKKGDEARFEGVETLEDLKCFSVGLSPDWSTYNIMLANKFKIINTKDYSSMFRMLERGRFDFVPRALNEVYSELELYKPLDEGLAVLPKIALYIPSASYMFVSPKQPRIFQRLNTGLHALSINGELSELSDKYYRSFTEKARMQSRRIITITHSGLPEYSPHQSILNNCKEQGL